MKLNIHSIDMHHEEYTGTFESEVKVEEGVKTYVYSDDHGEVTIKISGETMSIRRSGAIRYEQVFKNDNMVNFMYQSNYLESILTLVTKELIIESNNIKVSYELYNDGLLVNDVKMSISEE